MQNPSAIVLRRLSKIARTVRREARYALDFQIRTRLLPLKIRHLSGPVAPETAQEGPILLSIVLNGVHYLPTFMDHYKRLGVRRFCFLDTGSTDGTQDLLASYKDAIVLSTSVPFRVYENALKRYLAKTYSGGGWVIFSDIDELMDYPFSDRLSVHDLTEYLDYHRHTAVITQMLDMFPEAGIGSHDPTSFSSLKDECPVFDISNVKKRPYPFDAYGSCTDDTRRSIHMHRDGIRNALFGVELGLTKVSLFKMAQGVQPFVGWHHIRNARFADLSCVLLHYPFAGSFGDKIRDALDNERYDRPFIAHYKAYARKLSRSANLGLVPHAAQRYRGVAPLAEEGFVYMSERFRRWARERMASGGQQSADPGHVPSSGTL